MVANTVANAMNTNMPSFDGIDVLYAINARIAELAVTEGDKAAKAAYAQGNQYQELLNAANLVKLATVKSGNTSKVAPAISGAVTIWLKAQVKKGGIVTSLKETKKVPPSFLGADADNRVVNAWSGCLQELLQATNVPCEAGDKHYLFTGNALVVSPVGQKRGGAKRTYTVSRLLDCLQVADRIIVVKDGGIDTRYTRLDCAMLMAEAVSVARSEGGLVVSGLKANAKHHLPVRVGAKGAELALDIWDGYTTHAEAKPVAKALVGAGFMPSANVEAAAKHGYVQKVATLVGDNDSPTRLAELVRDAAGKVMGLRSADSAEKALTRVAKQHKGGLYSTNMRVLVISADKSMAKKRLGNQLVASALAGCGGFNTFGWNRFGCVRAVGFDKAGQKTVVGQMERVFHPNLLSGSGIQSVLAASKFEPLLVVTLTAVKSKLAKAALDWKEDKVKGGVIKYAVVDNVDVAITDFYSAGLFETVNEELQGVEAVVESFHRRTFGRTTPAVSQMLAEELGRRQWASVAEVLLDLEAKGTLRRRDTSAKLNLQMLQSLYSEIGPKALLKLLRAIKRAPQARAGRADLKMVYQVVTDSVKESEVATVELDAVLNLIHSAIIQSGAAEEQFSQYQHLGVVSALLSALLDHGKRWVRIVDGNQSVLMPSGAKLSREVTLGVGMAVKAELSGYTADVLRALWVAAQAGQDRTDNHRAITMANLVSARDSVLGKELANIRAFGLNGPLLSSWELKYNQVASPSLEAAEAAAEDFYGHPVVGVYGKPPQTMAQAAASLYVVNRGSFSDTDAILMGTAMYLSAYFIVSRQDDVDGDRASVVFAPKHAVPAKLAKANPLNPTTNPTWKASKDFLQEEADGCFIKPDAPVAKLYSVDDMIVALNNQRAAKGNVGLFTSFQQTVQSNVDYAVEGVVRALSSGDVITISAKAMCGGMTTLASLKAAKVAVDPAKAAKLARQFVLSVVIPTMGGAMQSDAMDRIKRDNSEQIKQLARLLSPREAARVYVPATAAEVDKSAELLVAAKRLTEGEYTPVDVQNVTNKGRTAGQVACIKLMDDYGFDPSRMPVVVELGKALNLNTTNKELLNGMAMCLILDAVAAVGFNIHGKVELFSTLFGNENKLARVGGNLDMILQRDDLEYANNVEAMLLDVMGRKGH